MAILPYLAAAGGAGTAYYLTKKTEEYEFNKKLDLLKNLLAMTPSQVAIMDAVKNMSLDEMETHAKLGLTEAERKQISERLTFEERVTEEVKNKCREMLPDF